MNSEMNRTTYKTLIKEDPLPITRSAGHMPGQVRYLHTLPDFE